MSLTNVRSIGNLTSGTPLVESLNILYNYASIKVALAESTIPVVSPARRLGSKFSPTNYLVVLVVLIILNTIFRTSKSLLARAKFSRFQKLHGCTPVAVMPNPLPLPWSLGRKYEVLKAYISGDLIDNHLYRKYEKYGYTHSIVSAVIGLQKGISTVEPQNMQAVLATRFDDYVRPKFAAVATEPLLKPGIFTTDGPVWHHWRTMIKPYFTRKRLNDNVVASERHMQLFFEAVGPVYSDGQTVDVDIFDPIYRMAMDTSTLFLFGLSAETQAACLRQVGVVSQYDTGQSAALHGFCTTFNEACHYVGHRTKLGSLYWIYGGSKYHRLCKTLHSMLDAFITEVCEAGKSSKTPEEDSLIRMMIAQDVPQKDVGQQIMHLLVAGMDTSAAALGWTFIMLASHPEVYQTLRTTVLTTFGSESAPLLDFSVETLKSCKYLTWCLNETLRLFPAAPINTRTAVRDTVLPVGGGPDGKSPVAVRKGARVQMGNYFMQRRKDLWGEDADLYRPERWEGRKLGWHFLPFSGGPQICIGQSYSMTQLSFALARFVQHYETIEPSPGSDNMRLGWKTVLMPGNGVKVRMKLAPDAK